MIVTTNKLIDSDYGLVPSEHFDHFDQLGQECCCCSNPIVGYPFISWDFSDNDSIARVALHTTCANRLVLGLARDLLELNEHKK